MLMPRFLFRLFCYFSLVLLIPAGFAQAQKGLKTKKIVEYFKEDSSKIEYVFYVLDTATDVKHGTYTWFFDNGRKKAVTQYVLGLVEGEFQTFYRSGVKRSEGTFRQGVIDGPCTNYFGSGQVENTGEYATGRRHGYWKYYNAGGGVVKTVEYNYGTEVKAPEN